MAFLHILLSILGTISWATEVDTLAPPVDIYWNRTNDIFLRSNNDHIVQVQIKERIRFICPFYTDSTTDRDDTEHYIIYRLPKRFYDSCHIPNVSESQLRNQYGIEKVHNCSTPYNQTDFTSFIDPFLALPGIYGGLSYVSGREYFFTSISTGPLSGINNRESTHSACKRYNMKAIVRVCCNDNSTFTCPAEAVKCNQTAGFTDPPIVTGDPPTTISTTTSSPTTSWKDVTTKILSTSANPREALEIQEIYDQFANSSDTRNTVSKYVVITSLILGVVAHELT